MKRVESFNVNNNYILHETLDSYKSRQHPLDGDIVGNSNSGVIGTNTPLNRSGITAILKRNGFSTNSNFTRAQSKSNLKVKINHLKSPRHAKHSKEFLQLVKQA